MINIILGPPGGGKSYEAVVYHLLVALKAGRKVVTNLPLCVDELCTIDDGYRDLIVLRHDDIEREVVRRKWNLFHRRHDEFKFTEKARPFASIADYGDKWRHPETGTGPLYIIDECHKALPRGKTDIAVEEWYAEHRHEFADVLLITQSIGKISTSVRDLIQVVYRVKKATAFGTNNSYIRKVVDGYGGETVNESIRTYKPQYFRFYKSHTRSDSAGKELAANDIVPIWMRWPFIGAAVCLVLVLLMLSFGVSLNPMKAGVKTADNLKAGQIKAALPAQPVQPAVMVQGLEKYDPMEPKRIEGKHPFSDYKLHITARLQGFAQVNGERVYRDVYSFVVSQNGVAAFSLTQKALEDSGYRVTPLADCSAKIEYSDMVQFFVACDRPTQTITGQAHGALQPI